MVDKQSAAGIVSDALRTAIINNELPAGERLRQDAIATRFGVSQMIVREAFKQLVVEGLLRNEPRRGVSVSRLNADEAWEISQLRALIEAQALQWAIPNMTQRDFDAYQKILADLDVAPTVDDKIVLNARFHEALYTPSEKPRTLEMIENLRKNFERYLRFTWEETHHLKQSQAEHWAILERCKKQDCEGACSLLRQHILSTGELLVASLNNIEAQSIQIRT
ncbi:GntR family transcriptional regulator [Salipiger sp. 1_MG-2023]|uniref:GntR family transcriptional regulator n=1 Tax=Salipiger sp. 1_MG-2023 TaxID=3062665 RepID=UPI0026E27FF3|nr:GntR family transcriptional regulator [Salipiger sp. 1_MG-2023]MDO6585140.1 GntR family transcriptional regulator [Salipiger sp. 1_MG-2023]